MALAYYGIKTPKTEHDDSYIWWLAGSENEAWSAFFTYPNRDGDKVRYRPTLYEAIKAYKAIGYECVKLEVKEVRDIKKLKERREMIEKALDIIDNLGLVRINTDSSFLNEYEYNYEDYLIEVADIIKKLGD